MEIKIVIHVERLLNVSYLFGRLSSLCFEGKIWGEYHEQIMKGKMVVKVKIWYKTNTNIQKFAIFKIALPSGKFQNEVWTWNSR